MASMDPAGTEVLARRYRRLLWAYPSWYRRERGAELLATMLDAAERGQRWPARGDVVDVLRRGIPCRLRLPVAIGYRAVAVLVVTFGAIAGAGAGGGLGMAGLAPPVTEAEAIALSEAVTGYRPLNVPGPRVRCPDYCIYEWHPDGDQVVAFDTHIGRNQGADQTTVAYWEPSTVDISAARDRLVAAGWTIDQERGGLRAHRGNLHLHLYTNGNWGAPPLQLTLERRLQSVPALALAVVVGAGAGLLAGWFVVSWVMNRYRRHTTTVRAAVGLLGLPLVALMHIVSMATGFFGLVLLIASRSSGHGLAWRFVLLLPATILELGPGIWLGMLVGLVLEWTHVAGALLAGAALVVALAGLPTRRQPSLDTRVPGSLPYPTPL